MNEEIKDRAKLISIVLSIPISEVLEILSEVNGDN